jgi:hypothetical protein
MLIFIDDFLLLIYGTGVVFDFQFLIDGFRSRDQALTWIFLGFRNEATQ